jgi:CRISPR/Cas system-associated endonuclease Cas1
VGLNPYVGFLPSAPASSPAPALDLMEELRPIIADSAVYHCNQQPIRLDERFRHRRACGESERRGAEELLPML